MSYKGFFLVLYLSCSSFGVNMGSEFLDVLQRKKTLMMRGMTMTHFIYVSQLLKCSLKDEMCSSLGN